MPGQRLKLQPQDAPPRTPSLRKTLHACLAVFLLGAIASLGIAWNVQQETSREAEERFDQQARLLENELKERFERNELALKSLRGIHAAEGGFDRRKFRRYWQARDFQQDFPGVRGFGVIEYVPREHLAPFLARERRDHGPDFELKTGGQASQLYVIRLVEPVENNRPALGLDIGREAVRRAAAEQAARSGLSTLTGVITLVQDNRRGPGFLLLKPLYRDGATPATVEQRLAQHAGFVYSPIVAEEIFAPMAKLTLGQSRFDIHVKDAAGQDTLAFASVDRPEDARLAQPTTPSKYRRDLTVSLHGQTFRLGVYSTPRFETGVDHARGALVGTGGTVLSALIALSLWLLGSGRARAEARARELTAEMQRLALVAERTNNSVIIADADNRIVWVNDAFTRLSGQTLDEVRGLRASEIRGDVQDPDDLRRIHQALDRGQSLTIEMVNQAKDGHAYWVDLDLQPLRDEAGRHAGYVAVERDITAFRETQERDRRHAAELATALRDSQALMGTIHTHAIVSEAGRDGRITRVNDAFCRISGYNREELIGQDHRIVNSGAQDRAFWNHMWRAIASGRPWRGQICNRAKDGSLYWVDSIIAPFQDAQGRIEKYVSIRFDITEARRAQEALTLERQRLEQILDGTNIGTWRVNLVTGENEIDKRWAGMLGYAPDELAPLTPRRWQDLLHPDDEQLARSRLIDYLQSRSQIYEVERRLRHKNGHWVWVLSRGTISSRTPDGRVEWLSGTHMDVTERHRLHDEIEQRGKLMAAILENVPGALCAFDADLNLLVENRQFRELLGLPESLFRQTPVRYENLIRFEAERGEFGAVDVDDLVARAMQLARRPTPANFERARPNGQTLEVHSQPMTDGGVVMTTLDITRRKQAEKEARQADEMLRQAIETLDEAFVIYDAQDRLLICNQRYRDTYPISAAVMKPGVSFAEIVRHGAEHGEYAGAVGRVDEWVAERVRQHQRADTDAIQEMSDGRFLRVVERKTSDGFTVGFRIDISDLVRARLAAEDASKSKGQFLANMSHEIRTPMNAILGMLDLLGHTELSARQRDYVEKTESAAKSLLGLLNDILDFSKVEAGKLTLEAAPMRMDHLMRDLAVILSSSTGGKPVEVLFDIDPRLPALLVGDSLRLKQILINLGGNAIKFTEQGMVVLRIEVLDAQPGKVSLEFSVRDTGIGIAPENLRRIFEGFSQAEASTTRRFGGTGLGLAISSRLVGMMGGQLEVQSEVGRGSRFHFRLDLPVADDAARMVDVAARTDIRQLQVLVIDDNPVALQVMQAMVEPMGWQAECAASGEQALRLIRERIARGQPPHDVVLVDWQMPGLDGWETSLQIRRLLSGPQSPVLLMVTAHGREMLSRRPAEEQALLGGFLVKPVTPSMLLDAVLEARHALGGPSRERAPAPSSEKRRLYGLRVLLVEDNKINQQVARELLEREGARVTLADNGELGVQAIAEADPPWHIVLMDVQMPVMDGYTATRKVRGELGLTSLPIIAMTANAMESDRQDALAAGMNDHVGKPFNLDELVALMLRLSGHAPPAVEAQTAATAALPDPGGELALPERAGEFDLRTALLRMGGDPSMLARILQGFARDLPRQPTELAALLARGQAEEARRLLHTLKGTAATVGATRLPKAVAGAEQRLRAGSAPEGEEARQLLAGMRAAVDAASADLAPVLARLAAEPAREASVAPLDHVALQSDLRELHALLRESDLASLDLFARVREQHGTALRQDLEALGEAMAGLNFGAAARLCEELRQRYTA